MPINKENIPKYRTSSPTRETQSDAPIVVKVADLIEMAMGPSEKNTVNFKMIQMILHILARNMRLLDQQVELRSSDAIQPHHSTKERGKTADFGEHRPVSTESKVQQKTAEGKHQPVSTETKDQQKTAETTATGAKIADRDKSKDREKIERDIIKEEKVETIPLSSALLQKMDEIRAKYFKEKEKTEPKEIKLAKLTVIRKVYLNEYEKREREAAIKEDADRYKDKERSLDEKHKLKLAKVDGTEGSKHLKAKKKGEKEMAKYRKKESKYMASSSSEMTDSSDDDENRMAMSLIYEIEKIERDTEMEQEDKLAKIAEIWEMHFRGKEREKVKLANMNDEERDKYLKDKDGRKLAKERERYEKEKATLATMNDEERDKYLKDRDERKIAKERERYEKEKEKAKLDAEENNKAGDRERESLLDEDKSKQANLEQKEKYMANLANMNESEREIYLKKKEMEERELSKDRKRSDSDKEKEKERKRYETEKLQLEKLNDEEKEKYLKDKEQREREKLDATDFDITEGDQKSESETEKDLKKKEKEESKRTKLDAKSIEKDHRDKEKESEKIEKEMEKLAKMNDEEKEKYLKDKEKTESEKLDTMDFDRTEGDKKSENEMEKETEESKRAKLDAQNILKGDKEKESEKIEKEMEKLANLNDDEKEKYLEVKEQREQAKFGPVDRERAEGEKDEKENAKIAQMNKTEREKYLKQKEKAKLDAKDGEREDRDSKIESELYQKEIKKLADMDNEKKENYFKAKEEREDANVHAQNREGTEREMDEKEKTKIALMNETEREKYLKQKEKEEIEKSELDTLNRERADGEKKEREREMDEKERTKIAQMNEIEREKYLKQKEKEEREKSNLDALNRERAERDKKRERETDRGQEREYEQKQEIEREREKKEREQELKREYEKKQEIERERAKDREREKERKQYKGKEKRQEEEKVRQQKKDKKRTQEKEEENETNLKEKELAKDKDSRTRVGSIEVVTRSEFELLETKVNELQEKTAPIPYPSMPDNQKLRSDLARGSASLTDTMQAMQVSSRVQATETAMGRMADLLTQLAVAGALPQDVVKQVGEVTAGMGRPAPGEALSGGELASRGIGTSGWRSQARRSFGTFPTDVDKSGVIGIDESTRTGTIAIDETVRSVGTAIDERIRTVGLVTDVDETRSIGTSSAKKYTGVTTASRALFHFSAFVTHPELDDAQRDLKDKMIKRANDMVLKALRLAEIADMNVRRVSDQMEVAIGVASRMNALFSLVNDYADQLNGFDSGVSTQMQNFNDQIFQTRCELNDGIAMLTLAIANPETEAVRELTKRYEDLVTDLDDNKNTLHKLGYFQNMMGDEMTRLMRNVEAMRATKADREELLDGIRDKADKDAMIGLVTQEVFEPARIKMDKGLDTCFKKFEEQDNVWTVALEDLMSFANAKATGVQLRRFVYKMEKELNNVQDEVHSLASAIGEPKAILLTRKISEGGTCGPCQAPARQEATADCQPPLLPAAVRKHPPIAEEPCTELVKKPRQLEEREHICKRWVGGSHTLVNKAVVHQQASGDVIRINMIPTKKYAGIGKDGKLYQLEEVLQPCGDCNQPGPEGEEGAGEPGVKKVQLEFDYT